MHRIDKNLILLVCGFCMMMSACSDKSAPKAQFQLKIKN